MHRRLIDLLVMIDQGADVRVKDLGISRTCRRAKPPQAGVDRRVDGRFFRGAAPGRIVPSVTLGMRLRVCFTQLVQPHGCEARGGFERPVGSPKF
jgi:hypothetical protein